MGSSPTLQDCVLEEAPPGGVQTMRAKKQASEYLIQLNLIQKNETLATSDFEFGMPALPRDGDDDACPLFGYPGKYR